MRYRFLLASALALGSSTCGDRELPTGSVATFAAELTDSSPVDTSTASSTCKAMIRARDRARIRLSEAPTDSVARHKAIAFEELLSQACK